MKKPVFACKTGRKRVKFFLLFSMEFCQTGHDCQCRGENFIREVKGCGVVRHFVAVAYEEIDTLCRLGKEGKIPYQREILLRGGTDTSSMQMAGCGSRACAISVPTRYIHSGVEMLDLNDAEACVELTVAWLRK